MIGVGLCFLIEFLDQTFKQPEELRNMMQLPVIGIIPDLDEKYFNIAKERIELA